jgi:hypothetical protein
MMFISEESRNYLKQSFIFLEHISREKYVKPVRNET